MQEQRDGDRHGLAGQVAKPATVRIERVGRPKHEGSGRETSVQL
ncbi:MAG: hypothetical protein ACKO1J_10040 [Tagaea sp.]